MGKVSVVVPIFNAEKYLDKCIKSILTQTFKDFEIVLVNDGSKDRSLRICKKYEKQDSRVIVIDKQNEGSIATRRRGVEISSSDYVMFVDADDWIDKQAVEILYNETINDQTDIAVCNMYNALGNGMLYKKKNNDSRYFKEDRLYTGEEIRNELTAAFIHGHPFPSSLCAKLYKKDLLLKSGKYLDRIKFLGDDLFYNLEMFLMVNRVKVINAPLYYYRQGSGFTSKYMPHLFDDAVNGYQIEREVIDEYYQDSLEKRNRVICVKLLNTLKTCLYNLFYSDMNEVEIKSKIHAYISNDIVKSCIYNEYSIEYFPKEFLFAIENKDINYLFNLGKINHEKTKHKRLIKILASKLAIF